MIKTIQTPSLSRVGPGNRSTLELVVGPTYYGLIFNISAAAGLDVTDIGRIDVLMNGRVVQTYKNLQRLMDINAFYNRVADTVGATAIEFGLHFFRGEMADSVYKRLPGIGTQDLGTFHIEMDIAAAAPADIAIKAHAIINPIAEPLGAFVNIREYPTSFSTSGEQEIDKLPKGDWYTAIHLFKSDISKVEVVTDNGSGPVKVVEATKAVLERYQKNASPIKRVPVTASCTHVDFTALDGNLQDTLPTAGLRDFRIKPTLTTSGAVDVVAETYSTLAA